MWITKKPEADHANPASADPPGNVPNLRGSPVGAEAPPEGVEHQARRIRRFHREESVEHEMRRIEDAHLALGEPGEAIAPEVVPEGKPARANSLAQHGHQSQGELGHVAPGRHPSPEADRPEPDTQPQQQDHRRQALGMTRLLGEILQSALPIGPTRDAEDQ
jgi:hypothetical protein